jgi:hypothetical protein
MYAIHTTLRIRRVDRDEQQRMDVDGQKGLDSWNQMNGISWMNIDES